jgi:hypothetical protein
MHHMLPEILGPRSPNLDLHVYANTVKIGNEPA